MKLTEEQIEAVNKGEAVHLAVPGVAGEVVLLRADQYEAFQELEQEKRIQEAWLTATQEGMSQWVHPGVES